MKKVLLGFLCISFVAVMSCGGSSGEPATAESSVAGAAVAACLSNNPTGFTSEINVNEGDYDWTVNEDLGTLVCDLGGSLTLTGTISVTGTDDSATVDGTLTETFTDCAITDTACNFGEVLGNGALTITINGDYSSSAATFAETIKGDLIWIFNEKTLPCNVDLAMNIDSNTTYTEQTILDAITGTVCGADWASVKAALADSAQMETLCAAFDAAATEL